MLDGYSGLLAEGLTCFFIGIFLVFLNPFLAFSLMGVTVLFAMGMVVGFKKEDRGVREKTREAFSERQQCAYQSVNGVKEITVMQMKRQFCQSVCARI